MCYAQCWKGSRCRMAQLVALEKLVDDEEEAQHMLWALGLPWSHWRGAKASWTQEMWNNVWFPDWGTYSVSPPTYIHVLEIKSDIHRKDHSMLLVVHPWCWPAMVCLSIHTCMMWSDLHQVRCGCAGLMSHRCDSAPPLGLRPHEALQI